MVRSWLGSTIAGAIFILSPAGAWAKCGTGNPPSYDDIRAVVITRDQGTFTGYKGFRAKTFGGSSYWAAFSDLAPNAPNTYSQNDLEGQIGTYTLSYTLKDAVSVLRRDNFFAVSLPDAFVTDVPVETISVKRCRTVTRLELLEWDGEDASGATLFGDLSALVEHSPKVKVSSQPTKFEDAILSDPRT